MFSGIAFGTTTINKLSEHDGYSSITVELATDHCTGLELGASVAIDGVCLTVSKLDCTTVSFDIINNSLKITTLNDLFIGRRVNYERSMVEGGEIGGHIISGHVDYTANVLQTPRAENGNGLVLEIPAEHRKYWFEKGFVGVNGCSLTISDLDKKAGHATLWLIPETLRLTNLGGVSVGSKVNIEIDRSTQILVDTINQAVDEKFGALSDTIHLLLEDSNLAGELAQKLKQN